jgi:aminoglycoside 6'-N-acetyltransferase
MDRMTASIDGGALEWRRLAADDLPLLARWLADPGVARWWNHDSSPEGVERDFGPSVRGDEPGEDLVVSLDGRAVGLVQRAVISDYPEDLAEFTDLVEVPGGAVELDYLVGEPDLRGRGLGPRIIAAVVDDTWTAHPAAPAVLVAVAATNVASWRALEKAGLRRVAGGPMTPESPADGALHHVYRVDRPGDRPPAADEFGGAVGSDRP